MNKRIVIMTGICACMLAVLSGCSKSEEKKDTVEENPTIEFTQEDNNEVGMGNPWVDITKEEAGKICARLFKAPEGAGAQEWLKCEALGDPDKGLGPLIQLNFDMDDLNFTARAQQGAAEDADIAGIYTDWTAGPEDVTLANWGGGNMKGQMYRSIDDTGYIDLITWYDIEIGIKYSLSVAAEDLDGFDIQAVAEQMYPGEDEPDENEYDVSDVSDASDAPKEAENADGVYGAYLKSSDESKIGTTDEYGLLYTVVYKSQLSEETLVLTGSMDYRNSREQDPISVSDDLMHVFTVNDSTVYQMIGGDAGPENVSLTEFAGYLEDCSDSGLYVEVEVKDGVAATVSISS